MATTTTTTKHYSNGQITVHWEPAKCFHSGVCVRGLPQVFRPSQKPWVKITAAPSDTITEQVKRCPSGALTVTVDDIPD